MANEINNIPSLRDTSQPSQNKAATAKTGQFSTVLASSGKNADLDAIFRKAAQTYQVPENLLKAIAKAESNFNSNALSSAGAQGIMQLMPKTAASLGVSDPFDPEQNIMGGAKYISQKIQAYDGDITLALAAYNAGSGNVAKYGGVPPFKETQNYLKKISEYMGQTIGTVANPAKSAPLVSNTSLAQASLEYPSGNYLADDPEKYMLLILAKYLDALNNDDSEKESSLFDQVLKI